MIEREGLEGANLREIAREGGYTTGVLSHYFRGKQELLSFAYGLVVDRHAERVSRATRQEGVLGALAELLPLDEERRRECVIWLVLTTASLEQPTLSEEVRRRCGQARAAMKSVFREVFEVSREEDLDYLSDELLAVTDGITVNALGDPERYPPERQLALLGRALERLGPDTQASASSAGSDGDYW